MATYALNPVTNGHVIPGVTNLVVIALIVVIVGYVGMHYSVFGRHTLAIGSSEEAARRVGLKVQRHLLKVYIVGGLANGFAGFLSLAYFSTTSVGGHTTDNLQAITAVALGGTSLFGGVATILGSLIGSGSRRSCRTASSSSASTPTGSSSPSASCWCWPCGWTSCGAGPRTAGDPPVNRRGLPAHHRPPGRDSGRGGTTQEKKEQL